MELVQSGGAAAKTETGFKLSQIRKGVMESLKLCAEMSEQSRGGENGGMGERGESIPYSRASS